MFIRACEWIDNPINDFYLLGIILILAVGFYFLMTKQGS